MSEHRALALKWRPEKFEDVIGQPHVVRTLRNAIAAGRTGQAYLFTGPRGVGKTTCARILARAVNCEKGAGPDPCGACATCKDFLSGRALDLIEIDAASTGKAEHVRDLTEVVRLAPARAKRKVIIIDEVHAMSSQAFNALLKTLEEPPAHVLFVLATTDPDDVPATIQSRCQRFDFRPLGPATLAAQLKKIAAAEGLDVEEPAVTVIARAARGAMRDAQMLMEQAAAYARGPVTAAEVRNLMGLVEADWVARFLAVLKDRDVPAGMALVEELLESGREPAELLAEVQDELRDALMARIGAKVTPLSAAALLAAPERAEWFAEDELLSLLGHVRRALDELKARAIRHPRIAAELAVARLLRRERPLSWAEVEGSLARLGGAGLSTGLRAGPDPGRGAGPAPAGIPPAPTAARPGGPPPRAPSPVPVASSAASALAAEPGRGASPELGRGAGPSPELRAGIPRVALARLPGAWTALLDAVKQHAPTAYVYLRHARCVSAGGGTIRVEVGSEFQRQGLAGTEMKGLVEGALAAVTGERVTLEVATTRAGSVPGTASPAAASDDLAQREPLVKAGIEIFKARLVGHKKPAGG